MDEEVIPILRVKDAAAAVAWYERLGFAKQWEHRFEPGFPAFVMSRRSPPSAVCRRRMLSGRVRLSCATLMATGCGIGTPTE